MEHSIQQAVSACIVTMGCAKNEVDSERMRERLSRAGYALVDDPEQADAIIINTCSFIQAATEESLAVIFEMADLPAVLAGESVVVVAGCMPARYGDDLAESLDEVKTFVPCSREDDIAGILDGLFPGRSRIVVEETEPADIAPSAYVKISDGCDRFCSYCAIPFIRGRYGSFTLEEIDASVRHEIDKGAREIVLIAQDTGRWGDDLTPPSTLAHLMDTLAGRFPEIWFRVMYLQPEGVSDELLTVMAEHDNIASYLDIPFQHASARVISDMNRSGCGDEYLKLLSRIREIVPDVTLRSTFIAGFPGETDDEFAELLDFVEQAELDYAGVFSYSAEEGTVAADLPDQVPEEVKAERTQQVRDLADAISHARVANRVGTQMDVLVIGREEDGQLFGRAMCQAPDVDGVVYLDDGEPGQVVRATIVDTLLYEMEGEIS